MTFQDTFHDYQEMFVQFGYVVLFSSAFPLAAMCALINNIIEIRSDAFKLCTGLQRPFGIRVESIGQWQVRKTQTQAREVFLPSDGDNWSNFRNAVRCDKGRLDGHPG